MKSGIFAAETGKRRIMVKNDYYNMNTDSVRKVIGMCEKSGVRSIAIEGYEWLLHNGVATESEYLRLMTLYHKRGDIFNLYRIENRYNAIYGTNNS